MFCFIRTSYTHTHTHTHTHNVCLPRSEFNNIDSLIYHIKMEFVSIDPPGIANLNPRMCDMLIRSRQLSSTEVIHTLFVDIEDSCMRTCGPMS